MKLVYAHEMGALDKKAAEEFYLPTAVLMENAGRAAAETAAELLGGDVYAKSVVVFAGKGNNGGDGLVAARWLSAGGARVKIFLASPAAEFAGTAGVQLKICAKSGLAVTELKEECDWNVAEIAAYRGRMLFYFDRDYYTLAELVRLPDRKKYGACVYIDADGSRQDRPGYANDIALQVDEWRRENGIPFDKSTIAASPSEADGGEFDTMDEALRYLYTCLNFPDSVLC